ncbi:hypothetical protein EYF80_043951 [Liparis tanakae]|uniref:Uncharacterized protein n=1 Tax=Liparis tanakae TaxID=230148 RepID=A0A4Z2FYS7_9TELE|nr:hypothetical protein EYF80_043951 [Liparis tanakae]
MGRVNLPAGDLLNGSKTQEFWATLAAVFAGCQSTVSWLWLQTERRDKGENDVSLLIFNLERQQGCGTWM